MTHTTQAQSLMGTAKRPHKIRGLTRMFSLTIAAGFIALGSVATGVGTPDAQATEPLTCPTDRGWLEGAPYLRALSLDLRGKLPTVEEVAQYANTPEDAVDAWLADPSFSDQAVRFHRSLLWNNVSDLRLLYNPNFLAATSGIYFRRGAADSLRGTLNAHCGTEEATFDDNGDLVVTTLADGTLQEGWVWVNPYWSPDDPIKVCAFDAQDNEISPTGTDCSLALDQDPLCGCGPDLAYCGTGASHEPVAVAMGTDVDLRVKRVIDQDLPYHELLTSDIGFVNGPLVHFYTKQAQAPSAIRFSELPIDLQVLPDLVFTDEDVWQEVPLGDEHSGILTSPGFLTRFATDRARANRFYNAFLCQPFTPPEEGISDLNNLKPSLDLTQRAGCDYCHALLEPAASHWGRWTENGGGFLDPEGYPAFSDECEACGTAGPCPESCDRFYTITTLDVEEDPFMGWLSSYKFVEERHFANIEQGPELLVNQSLVDGRLATCSAKNAGEWLLGRELAADDPWVEEVADIFVDEAYDYKAMIRHIVLSEPYRRVE